MVASKGQYMHMWWCVVHVWLSVITCDEIFCVQINKWTHCLITVQKCTYLLSTFQYSEYQYIQNIDKNEWLYMITCVVHEWLSMITCLVHEGLSMITCVVHEGLYMFTCVVHEWLSMMTCVVHEGISGITCVAYPGWWFRCWQEWEVAAMYRLVRSCPSPQHYIVINGAGFLRSDNDHVLTLAYCWLIRHIHHRAVISQNTCSTTTKSGMWLERHALISV